MQVVLHDRGIDVEDGTIDVSSYLCPPRRFYSTRVLGRGFSLQKHRYTHKLLTMLFRRFGSTTLRPMSKRPSSTIALPYLHVVSPTSPMHTAVVSTPQCASESILFENIAKSLILVQV